MSDAIIARGSRSGGSSQLQKIKVLQSEIITQNTQWIVPIDAVNNMFSVRIFGGGGGGAGVNSTYGCGGGGGWMNNADLELTPGSIIKIDIGSGGSCSFVNFNSSYSYVNSEASSGGTTFFGTLLSANGGKGAFVQYSRDSGLSMCYPGSGGSSGGGLILKSTAILDSNAYQFGGGGGGGPTYGIGLDGGTYGGGGGGCYRGKGGNGGMYGGGGGGTTGSDSSHWATGGNGGTYGGGGGGHYISSGGTYGGSGGNSSKTASYGTDTSSWTNVFNDGNGYFRGSGRPGFFVKWYSNNTITDGTNSYVAGGGGFGGNGGNGCNYGSINRCGGGGGYGSNGGNGYVLNSSTTNKYLIGSGGGGGGGYGGDGGSNCGGGGGYGKTAIGGSNCGGGGGYYGKGGNNYGGGGGYGDGGDAYTNSDGIYGGGGGGGDYYYISTNGGSGVCIIQYYKYISVES